MLSYHQALYQLGTLQKGPHKLDSFHKAVPQTWTSQFLRLLERFFDKLSSLIFSAVATEKEVKKKKTQI